MFGHKQRPSLHVWQPQTREASEVSIIRGSQDRSAAPEPGRRPACRQAKEEETNRGRDRVARRIEEGRLEVSWKKHEVGAEALVQSVVV